MTREELRLEIKRETEKFLDRGLLLAVLDIIEGGKSPTDILIVKKQAQRLHDLLKQEARLG